MHALSRTALVAIGFGIGGVGGFVGGLVDDRFRRPGGSADRPAGRSAAHPVGAGGRAGVGGRSGAAAVAACAPRGVRVRV